MAWRNHEVIPPINNCPRLFRYPNCIRMLHYPSMFLKNICLCSTRNSPINNTPLLSITYSNRTESSVEQPDSVVKQYPWRLWKRLCRPHIAVRCDHFPFPWVAGDEERGKQLYGGTRPRISVLLQEQRCRTALWDWHHPHLLMNVTFLAEFQQRQRGQWQRSERMSSPVHNRVNHF